MMCSLREHTHQISKFHCVPKVYISYSLLKTIEKCHRQEIDNLNRCSENTYPTQY